MKTLYKYDGCVLDGNNHVRMREYTDYVYANSKEQAILLLTRRYRKNNNLSTRAYVKLKEYYLKEVINYLL